MSFTSKSLDVLGDARASATFCSRGIFTNVDVVLPNRLLHPQIFDLKMFDSTSTSAQHDSATSGGIDFVLDAAPIFSKSLTQHIDETSELFNSMHAAVQFSFA